MGAKVGVHGERLTWLARGQKSWSMGSEKIDVGSHYQFIP